MESNRYEDLLDRVVEGTAAAVNRFDVDELEHLARHGGGTHTRRFRDEILKHMRSKSRRDAAALLQEAGVPAKLAVIERAEASAWDRRVRFESGEQLGPHEHPVRLDQLSIEQLVDCQLYVAREQWLAELEDRGARAESEAASLRAELETKRLALNEKLAEAEKRLQALRHVREDLAGP